MVPILRNIMWFAVYLVATFLFLVLIEHGISDLPRAAESEWKDLNALAFPTPPPAQPANPVATTGTDGAPASTGTDAASTTGSTSVEMPADATAPTPAQPASDKPGQ